MAPIERKYRKQSAEKTKPQSCIAKQEPKKPYQRKASFVCVPTIMTRQNPINYRQYVIEQCTLTLNHACTCENVNCRVEHCSSMKRVWKHVVSCKSGWSQKNCTICKNFHILASYHMKQCKDASCNLVFCSAIRKRRQSRTQLLES